LILGKEKGLSQNAATDAVILPRIVRLPTVEGDPFSHFRK
jgi:hypothetical protein